MLSLTFDRYLYSHSQMTAVFGVERGTHARSAVGTNSLPRQAPVEIELIAEVEPAEMVS